MKRSGSLRRFMQLAHHETHADQRRMALKGIPTYGLGAVALSPNGSKLIAAGGRRGGMPTIPLSTGRVMVSRTVPFHDKVFVMTQFMPCSLADRNGFGWHELM